MRPTPRHPATTGLDISLLGVIVAAVGFYAGSLPTAATGTPNLVRFGEGARGTAAPAAMPQDQALLLLSSSGGDTAGTVAHSLDPFWSFLVVLGLTMVVAGPVWAWMYS